MYIKLIRNKPQGNAITGRLVIDGRWFCYTLERKGVEIPALCYHVAVTQSPKFKRLLPLVTGVPRTMSNVESQKSKVNETSAAVSPDFKHSTLDIKQSALRSGIRIHRGSKSEHSSGCVLVVGDNKNDNTDNLQSTPKIDRFFGDPAGNLINDNTDNLRPNRTRSDRSNACEIRIPLGAHGEYSSPRQEVDCRGMLSPLSSNNNHSLSSNKNIVVSSSLEGVLISPDGSNDRSAYDSSEMLSKLSSKHIPVGCRSAADVEQELTSLILKAQQDHEEIILEVIDFTPGSEYGYNTPCERELQER